ncbi:hypothetical protein WA158_004838 [Blastocystis sp. Blastoise]
MNKILTIAPKTFLLLHKSVARVSISSISVFSQNMLNMEHNSKRYFGSACHCNGDVKCASSCDQCEHLTKCWNCASFNDCNDRFCHKCKKILPFIEVSSSPSDYFKMFNLEPKYDIDMKVLLESFHNLQRKLHPDLFSQKSQKEKDIAATVSSIVNQAYEKIKNPLYIQTGNDVLGEGKVSVPASPMLLMEIMELNEEIDMTKSAKELKQYLKQAEKRFHDFELDFINTYNSKNYKQAMDALYGMKYYDKVMYDINEKLVTFI